VPESNDSKFPNIKSALDVYVLAHLFGWLAKTVIFRNDILIWIMSIGFEILERSLNQFIPNFHECWWDSLLLDLFGCNLIGILLGNLIIKKLKL
jgi:phosphatidylserine synthase 2